VPYANRVFMPVVNMLPESWATPAPGRAVTASSTRQGRYVATTDENGLYRFSNLPAGFYQLRAEKAGLVFSPTMRLVALPLAGERDFELLMQAPVILPATRIISDETNATLVSISPDGAVFTFEPATPELESLNAGEIMVGGPCMAAPYGYLRKVTKVSAQGGQVIVETEPALLEHSYASPQAGREAEVKGYYAPRLSLELYGQSGLYMQPGQYLEFTAAPDASQR